MKHIVTYLSGSHAYGTNTKDSDVDIRGCFLGDKKDIRTPFGSGNDELSGNQWNPLEGLQYGDDMGDAKWTELNKFMKLILLSNPNAVEALWVKPEHVLLCSKEYGLLRNHRKSFLCKRVINTHLGYASSQIKKLKSRSKMINIPEHLKEEFPKEKNYLRLIQNFTEEKILPNDFNVDNCNKGYAIFQYDGLKYGLYEMNHSEVYNQYGKLFLKRFQENDIRVDRKSPLMLLEFNNAQYEADVKMHKRYRDWKTHRNKDRAEKEQEMGFDLKNATHLIRLTKMAKEVALTGQLNVWRDDAKFLLDIRNGKYAYDEVLQMSESIYEEVQEIEESGKCVLQDKPDYKLAMELILQIQDELWKE